MAGIFSLSYRLHIRQYPRHHARKASADATHGAFSDNALDDLLHDISVAASAGEIRSITFALYKLRRQTHDSLVKERACHAYIRVGKSVDAGLSTRRSVSAGLGDLVVQPLSAGCPCGWVATLSYDQCQASQQKSDEKGDQLHLELWITITKSLLIFSQMEVSLR